MLTDGRDRSRHWPRSPVLWLTTRPWATRRELGTPSLSHVGDSGCTSMSAFVEMNLWILWVVFCFFNRFSPPHPHTSQYRFRANQDSLNSAGGLPCHFHMQTPGLKMMLAAYPQCLRARTKALRTGSLHLSHPSLDILLSARGPP